MKLVGLVLISLAASPALAQKPSEGTRQTELQLLDAFSDHFGANPKCKGEDLTQCEFYSPTRLADVERANLTLLASQVLGSPALGSAWIEKMEGALNQVANEQNVSHQVRLQRYAVKSLRKYRMEVVSNPDPKSVFAGLPSPLELPPVASIGGQTEKRFPVGPELNSKDPSKDSRSLIHPGSKPANN